MVSWLLRQVIHQSLFKMFRKNLRYDRNGKGRVEKAVLKPNMVVLVRIPTNRPLRQNATLHHPDNLYVTLSPESVCLSRAITSPYHSKAIHSWILPDQAETSQLYLSLLLREGISHNVLTRQSWQREAQIYRRVWPDGGSDRCDFLFWAKPPRGMDVKLGPGVAEFGVGLIVIGTEWMVV